MFNPAGPCPTWLRRNGYSTTGLSNGHPRVTAGGRLPAKRPPGAFIGFGGIAPLNYLTQRRINLGYRLAVEAWGQGYATELGARAGAGVETLNLPEVFGLVRPDHAASIRVLEKVGLQRFGLLDDVPGQAPSLVLGICHPTTTSL